MAEPFFSERVAAAFQRLADSDIVSAYLFGSRREGRAHRDSDADLGVLFRHDRLPTAKERFEARLRLVSRLPSELGGVPVDLVILNDCPPTLGARIVTEGERVYCTALEADHAFVRDSQLRAADLAPFLRRMRRLKLEALAR